MKEPINVLYAIGGLPDVLKSARIVSFADDRYKLIFQSKENSRERSLFYNTLSEAKESPVFLDKKIIWQKK